MIGAPRIALAIAAAAVALSIAMPALSQQAVTLHGAVQFNDDHAFNKALLKFEELVKKYYGKPINFRAPPQQRTRPGEGLLRLHEPGQGRRLRHRVPGAHVDLLQGGAVHRRAVPVPRSRSLEQSA